MARFIFEIFFISPERKRQTVTPSNSDISNRLCKLGEGVITVTKCPRDTNSKANSCIIFAPTLILLGK
jgi:hypothetical protein